MHGSAARRDDDLAEFREEVRRFVETRLPVDIKETVAARRNISRDQAMRWQKVLHAAGWGAPGWPKDYGGTGWPLRKQAVMLEELALAGAPATESLGLSTIAPTLIRHGTPEQRARFLPGIIAFDDFWAQAYSEPGSGSDLASLKCAARREGDHYIVSGTKIWQSHAHWANWAFTLVRLNTEPREGERRRKQDGITVLLIDLKASGVTVRPIRFMHGRLFHSQIFFDDVRVPVENRVGAEGSGWSVAKDLLVVERLFGGRVAECRNQLNNLKQLARTHGPNGTDLLAQPWFARRVAELEVRLGSYHAAWWSAVAAVEAGENVDVEVSKLRLVGTILLQDIYGIELETAASQGLLAPPRPVPGQQPNEVKALTADNSENLHILHFRHRGITLGSGSAEVQRDIIARDVFNRLGPGDRKQWSGEEQQMLGDAIERFLERDYDFERRRGIIADDACLDPAVWQGFADLGVLGLLVPEASGGYGGKAGDLAVVAESMGKALVVEPYAWTVAIASALAAIDAAGHAPVLEDIIAGRTRVALAYLEDGARFDPATCETVARSSGSNWILSGRKILVWGAAGAGRLIVTARIDGPAGDIALFWLDPAAAGLTSSERRTYNDRAVGELSLRDVTVPAGALIARGDAAASTIGRVLDIVTLATTAEAVGAMDRGLGITIEYMKMRQQFGQPIADFQALRHRVVEHCLALFNLRSQLLLAAKSFEAGYDRTTAADVAAAKWMAGRAARQIGHDILQLHGAVGFQEETPISHYAKHLVASDAMLGDSEFQLSRFIELQGERPATA